MECPRDKTRLEPKIVKGHQIQTCKMCFGVWIDKDAYKAAKKLEGEDPLNKEISPPSKEIDTAGIKCPLDGYRMDIKKVHDVNIDICTLCESIWLDGGELKMIINNKKLGIGRAVGDLAISAAPDLLMLGIEGLFEILASLSP